MVLRRTGLDDLPLFVVLGISASLLVWAGWGGDSARHVQAGPPRARAEHESGVALPTDRLASAAGLTNALVEGVGRRVVALTPLASSHGVPSADGLELRPDSDSASALELLRRGIDLGDTGSAEGELVDGHPIGRWVLFDEHGRRIFVGGFGETGDPVGVWSWLHTNGQIAVEGAFSEGQADGLWREWHANGAPASSMQFENGLPSGPAEEWFENGGPKQEGAFDIGERVGVWQSWYSNGNLRARGAYVRGLRSGLWEEWHADGRPMLVATYVRGRAQGLWQAWYSNGQVKERGSFEDGRREGVWHFFDFGGAIDLRTGFYRNGRMVRD